MNRRPLTVGELIDILKKLDKNKTILCIYSCEDDIIAEEIFSIDEFESVQLNLKSYYIIIKDSKKKVFKIINLSIKNGDQFLPFNILNY